MAFLSIFFKCPVDIYRVNADFDAGLSGQFNGVGKKPQGKQEVATLTVEFLQAVARELVLRANAGELISYGELAYKMDFTPIALRFPLGTLSEIAVSNGFPAISAIVVNKDTGMPGEGFFDFVGELTGHPNLPMREYESFWLQQCNTVFACTTWDTFLAELPKFFAIYQDA